MTPHSARRIAGGPAPGHPVLSIEGLNVCTAGGRNAATVLNDVSFTIDPGETVCVVGESGSGKSVSSLAVMGLLPPGELRVESGRILVNGVDMLTIGPAALRALRATEMAIVFQEPMTALNPVETVGFQIEEVLRLHTRLSRKARRERVLQMLESVHLPQPERVYRAYPHQLSGGQRQRIVIAMALILGPRLLIADEPTTALDVTTQKQILTLIRELQERHNTAVLFITHDFGVVSEIADRIVVMHHGRVVETGSRTDILSNPRQVYTRSLVTSVPSLVPAAPNPIQPDCILDVRKLGKIYAGRGVLKRVKALPAATDISFSLHRSEIAGIVGESGSGKSTVARCIAHLMPASEGAIVLDGTDIARKPVGTLGTARRHIQVVFQDPYRSLNPRMRIGESLIEGLTNFGETRQAALQKAGALLEVVGLAPEALQRYPHQFSGGQRQRICIARALALEPQVLIADEAVSALDVSVQAQVLRLLREIRERTGIAVLFITHDLRVAAQICDSIIVMHQGRIVESGSTRAVLTQPQAPYTQSLIAAAPGKHWDFQNLCPLPTAEPDYPHPIRSGLSTPDIPGVSHAQPITRRQP